MPFNQEKATASAAFLLKLHGGQMSYLKLIKLLYLADREALNRWGFNITTDRYVSMKHGPVVSRIYNLITIDEKDSAFWAKYITPPLGQYEVALTGAEVPSEYLSQAEENLLAEIYNKYKTWDRWKLSEFTHTLSEWKDPGTSSTPIAMEDILKAQGATDEDAKGALADYYAAENADRVLGVR